MKATCDTDAEAAAGREPHEMSRPIASSRCGFVESQGCGVQVLTSAKLALDMGLPIHGIVAYTSLSADKCGRSVPAPGRGVMTNAREAISQEMPGSLKDGVSTWPLLDIHHRRKILERRRQQIAEFTRESQAQLDEHIDGLAGMSWAELDEYRRVHACAIEEEAASQEREAVFNLGNAFWRNGPQQRISPMRGALATWGLTIDDLSVASLHGTSTVQNDTNEASVIQEQMRHLGRQEGNLLPCVCQKWLTGHSKAAAGAWMVNGCLQMMTSGLVPGNRNVDNVDERLRRHHYLWFPSETGHESLVKACSVTSFGFGQKGAQALLVHPRYLYGTLSKTAYSEYCERMRGRTERSSQAFLGGMLREDLVSSRMKKRPPFAEEDEMSAYLNPNARFY